jgi:DNA repair protein RecO (recombination protein O)
MRPGYFEAIVLSIRDYGEADKIVTLFTLEHGKIDGIARNAKKSRKRFGGSLEVFARIRFLAILKEGLSRLDDAELITVFPHIREDLAKIGHAGYACELVDRLLPEAQPNKRLFRLLVSYLEYIDSTLPIADDRRFFEVNLLNILGYRIPLENCAQCGVALDPEMNLSYRPQSGFFCGKCAGKGLNISDGTLSLLKMSMSTGRFGRIRFAGHTLREVEDVLDSTIALLLDRPLVSLSFLREVLHVNAAIVEPINSR